MKTKGITIWEEHLEKMVLGISVLALFGLGAMQFMGKQNTVDMPGIGQVGPDTVNEKLEVKAQSLLTKLSQKTTSISLPTPKKPSEYYDDRVTAPISPQTSMAMLFRADHPAISDLDVPPPMNAEFQVVSIIAPHEVVVNQYHDALLPEVLDEYPELKQQFPDPTKPLDLSYTTVTAVIDISEMLRQYKEDQDTSDDARPIPHRWYDEQIDIFDLVVEREERVNGAWTNGQIIDAIPGQLTLRSDLNDIKQQLVKNSKLDPGHKAQIIKQARDASVRSDILQPSFYDTKASVWEPVNPESRDQEYDKNDPLQKAREDLRRWRSQRNLLEQKVRDAGGTPERPDPQPEGSGDEGDGDDQPQGQRPGGVGRPGGDRPRGAPGAGGSRGAPGVGGSNPAGEGGGRRPLGGGSGRRPGGRGRPGGDSSSQIDKWKKQLEQIYQRITRFETLVRELGGEDVDEEPGLFKLDNERIIVWGHDLTTQPGHTYRYRVSIELYNPFFGQGFILRKDQKQLAEVFSDESAKSDWTDQVTIRPPVSVYVVRAEATQPSDFAVGLRVGNLGLTTVVVYRFHDGRWWSEKFIVNPGERIGTKKTVKIPAIEDQPAESREIDFTTNWFVVDIARNMDDVDTFGRRAEDIVMIQNFSDDKIELRIPSIDRELPSRGELDREIANASDSIQPTR